MSDYDDAISRSSYETARNLFDTSASLSGMSESFQTQAWRALGPDDERPTAPPGDRDRDHGHGQIHKTGHAQSVCMTPQPANSHVQRVQSIPPVQLGDVKVLQQQQIPPPVQQHAPISNQQREIPQPLLQHQLPAQQPLPSQALSQPSGVQQPSTVLPVQSKGPVTIIPVVYLLHNASTSQLLMTLAQRYAFLFSLAPFAVAVAMHSSKLLSLGLIISAGLEVVNLTITLAAFADGQSHYWPHVLDISLAAFFGVMLGTRYGGQFDRELQSKYFVIMITGWLAVLTLVSILIMQPFMLGYQVIATHHSERLVALTYRTSWIWCGSFLLMAILQLVPLLAVPDERETVIIIEWAVVFGLMLLTTMITRIQPLGQASGFNQLKVNENSFQPPVLQEIHTGSAMTSQNSAAARSRRSDIDLASQGPTPEPSGTQPGQVSNPV